MPGFAEFARSLRAEVLCGEPMSRHTTFKIGGPADFLVIPENAESLIAIAAFCRENGLPVMALGNGSNLLVGDEGIRGVVLSLQKLTAVTLEGERIRCGAGATLLDVCRFAAAQALTGLEFAYGIPGTVGGAVYMNAGAYGGEMKDVTAKSTHLGKEGPETLSGGELAFGYRRSAYTDTDKIILEVELALRPGDQSGIETAMRELFERRKTKQPLEFPSAGSVFKRPPGGYAGTLIEQCGLKGRRVGGAEVSQKHAGFIVNTGGATCRDVLTLIEIVQQEVLRRTGVQLECEIKPIVQ